MKGFKNFYIDFLLIMWTILGSSISYASAKDAFDFTFVNYSYYVAVVERMETQNEITCYEDQWYCRTLVFIPPGESRHLMAFKNNSAMFQLGNFWLIKKIDKNYNILCAGSLHFIHRLKFSEYNTGYRIIGPWYYGLHPMCSGLEKAVVEYGITPGAYEYKNGYTYHGLTIEIY